MSPWPNNYSSFLASEFNRRYYEPLRMLLFAAIMTVVLFMASRLVITGVGLVLGAFIYQFCSMQLSWLFSLAHFTIGVG